KRPQMGAIAERHSDYIVATTDNPRSENAADIIDDIAAGLTQRDKLTIINDRAAAIAWAIENATDNDVVLIAGKGHEGYQEIAGQRRPFSDYAVAQAALHARKGAA
ncbi:MAG: UDP-N-acetylmuramoyl-L-alanyl-D-glutamate--2,6-diaminopimelate ligase, partial [Gammaproteobacteria bacterium]|nr:UDP-N-acetylmuramoyl-L-alanyl-D-glutamate--2,6-diaminopimelate ligase [Gammaproteobacteria bacterium]